MYINKFGSSRGGFLKLCVVCLAIKYLRLHNKMINYLHKHPRNLDLLCHCKIIHNDCIRS